MNPSPPQLSASSLVSWELTWQLRDAKAVVLKVKEVLWPTKSFSENDAVTKDWDLWGPLVFCLVLSLLMSFGASENQSQVVFTGIFTMVWLGEAICTLNLKLLGGTVYLPSLPSPRCIVVC